MGPITKVIVGVVVSSALLATWAMQYLEPILTAKNELALINAQIAEKRAESQKLKNVELSIRLSETKSKLQDELQEVLRLNEKLIRDLENIKNERQKLLTRYKKLEQQYQAIAQNQNEGAIAEDDFLSESSASDLESAIKYLQNEISSAEELKLQSLSRDKELRDILNRSQLDGIWRVSNSTIDDKNVYLEFLPQGDVRTYSGLNGQSWIFSNKKWRLKSGQLLIEQSQGDSVLTSSGRMINGEMIIGESELPDGDSIPWKLTKVRN